MPYLEQENFDASFWAMRINRTDGLAKFIRLGSRLYWEALSNLNKEALLSHSGLPKADFTGQFIAAIKEGHRVLYTFQTEQNSQEEKEKTRTLLEKWASGTGIEIKIF